MNAAVRQFCQTVPILRNVYSAARTHYNRRRFLGAARGYFANFDEYRKALELEDGKVVDITTKDGLVFSIRRNSMDASILAEIFLDNCYVRGLALPPSPIVVDIGGYIGDSAIYAAKYLNARKVVVCEPSPRNWTLLTRNVANNHYEDRIEMVNMAVTGGEDVLLNVDAPDRGQARVSAYGPNNVERRRVPTVTLATLVESHKLQEIDLLKMDCEGGEYAILAAMPSDLLKRIRNIVFEFHEIDGFRAMLEAVKQRLVTAGFSLTQRGSLIFAIRQ